MILPRKHGPGGQDRLPWPRRATQRFPSARWLQVLAPCGLHVLLRCFTLLVPRSLTLPLRGPFTLLLSLFLTALLPLLVASCYTQVRDPGLTARPDPARSGGPQGETADGRRGEARYDRRGHSRGPSEGTLVLIVDYATLAFENWILVAASPWPAGGRDLEIRADRDRQVQTVSFRYPGTDAMIFQATSVWGGSGRIEFPMEWRPYDGLPRGGQEAVPTWMRVYTAQGPGEVVLYDDLPYAHEAGQDLLDLWYAVSDRELVSDWAGNGAWVGAWLYKPSLEPGHMVGAKWVVFVRG